MANYHAVYIDSPSSWTYAPDSYDSKLGFYTNAWLTNQTEEESETPVISCSYFYEIGKEDDVGFTPRRINYNSSSGILTVEGKQSGVPSLVSKSFRKKSPSPRFLNLRESLRKRRPARFIVSQIITDDNDSLVNIKKYLGIDEEGEEKSAEGIGSILGNVIPEPHFVGYEEIKKEKMKNQNMKDAEEFDDMGYPLKMDRFSYQNEGKVRDVDGNELRQYRIYFGKEPMFYLNDAVFGYDNNNTVQEVVDDLNEALKDSIEEVFTRLLWKSQRHDSLDVMLRGEEFGAENYNDWSKKRLIDEVKSLRLSYDDCQDMLNDDFIQDYYLAEEFEAEMNHLWMADALWYNLVYGSRMGFLELHMGEMNLPLMVMMGRMKMPENLDELSKAIGESPKSTARLLANYAEHNGWITVDMRNDIVKSVGFNAEEFGAEGGSKCEGKELKDSGYCDLDFDYSSSGLYAKCSDCGNEEFQDEYWDSQRISYTEPDEGQVLCSVKYDGSEDDLGYCSFDWNWGSGYAYGDCAICGTGVQATFDNQFYDDDDDEYFSAEEEDAERIMKLLRIVKRKATGSNARYAKTYADAAEMAYYDYGFKGLKTQVAYVLSNLGGWRGDEAKQVKAELRKLMR